ncbi:hypothetical protein KIN20_017040 [Parelaphostrongylus tenuis]|uniref:Uncharacterized protein n=1 Tax=Parelaphostrongylus tenuis TaxID=148309 RepID=A0AAD5QND6_PARTN|nr:hypothetical protein KIN20_017040 [Parelaphostrongylus tenuis]
MICTSVNVRRGGARFSPKAEHEIVGLLNVENVEEAVELRETTRTSSIALYCQPPMQIAPTEDRLTSITCSET